ncbi:MAG TPA: hypothetical protein PKJ33_03505 [Alphaproteobacteria bacterium]|nr:hypothetical protein [Alphaproteobacteria bacterium]
MIINKKNFNNKISKQLLFVTCYFLICIGNANAEIRVGNYSRSYANDYNQVAAVKQESEVSTTLANLPVRVANKTLADKIARGDTTAGVSVSNLESCANIYPSSGSFAWDTPTAGLKAGSSSTCIAVVEMRVVKGSDDIVVARANIAAGDSIECNISKFPQSSYTSDAGSVVFPADREPTVDDVVKAMNNEQKKNAALKIAAGALVGGLAGNAVGKNEVGQTGILGGGKDKMQGTAIGALSGAALMAGNSYSGKVGGDVILSAGVNAAAGGVIGNMVANGDSVLRIEDCTYPDGKTKSKCLWGVIEEADSKKTVPDAYFNITNKKDFIVKENGKYTKATRLINVRFDGADNKDKYLEDAISEPNFFTRKEVKKFSYDEKNNSVSESDSGDWVQIKSAAYPGKATPAMIDINGTDLKDKVFGLKMKDWYKARSNIKIDNLLGRNANGESYDLGDAKQAFTIDSFYPLTVDADDGALIDVNNKARMKGTLVGAGAGASLGAFTAYQGAQDEIDARWISAVQEYKDSLQKVYCATGTRFLSQYNDLTVIPNMQ